jgi:hypothetical protein
MPLILGTNSIKDTGFNVNNSARFKGESPDVLKLPAAGSDGDQKHWTVSMWIKRSKLGDEQHVWGWSRDGTNAEGGFAFDSNDQIFFISDGQNGGTNEIDGVFRDPSAWFHLVWACDADNGTNALRWRVYINGVERDITGDPTISDANGIVNRGSSQEHWIGDRARSVNSNTNSVPFSGYLAEVVFIDDTTLGPTSFGEFDEASGIWKPIDVSGLTFGSKGYYLNFQDSAELGTDVSGNNYDFAETGLTAVDQSTDTCTNNFATMNPINVPTSNISNFLKGNLEVESATTTGQRFMGSSTIGVAAGKWYAECKIVVIDSATVGVSSDVQQHAKDSTYIGSHQYDYSILPDSGNKYNNNSGSTHGDAFSVNDILMIALDMENENVYFGRNGSWFDGSGNADESSPNSALSLITLGNTPENFYYFACSDGGGSAKAKVQWNFGSPPYTISSGNTDANGYGNFEYAVPSGYFSLCTKNLAEHG